jgi:glycosyltransferase involved in cell wall biosynthesis
LPQVNKIRRIVIASVLKPVDETRMFEKFGLSLVNTGRFEVHIIGYPSSAEIKSSKSTIILHPLYKNDYKRISLQRLLAPCRFLRICLYLKPDILIITTHELLFMAWILKQIRGCKLIYDVQENYFRNILYGKAFPVGIRQLLAVWARLKERIFAKSIDQFILAEKAYRDEMPFLNPNLVLQNKVTRQIREVYHKKNHSSWSKLLFTGTVAETTGIREVIHLAEQLHKIDSRFSLTIVGHCPSSSLLKNLQDEANAKSFIHLKISERPVLHKSILKAIQESDFGIIWYPYNPSTSGSIPTKLFEYIALHLPVLIHHNSESHQMVNTCRAGFVLTDKIVPEELANQIKSFRYTELPDEQHLLWEHEFKAFTEVLK